MTKLKKCMLILMLGAGFGASLNAWALPGCAACNSIYAECENGNAAACDMFERLQCFDMYSGQACAIF